MSKKTETQIIDKNFKIISKEKINNITYKYIIEISNEEFESWTLNYRINKSVPGFRVGNAPLSYFQKNWEDFMSMSIVKSLKNDEKEELNDLFNYYSLYSKNEEKKIFILDLQIEKNPIIPQLSNDIEINVLAAKVNNIEIEETIENWKINKFKPSLIVNRPIKDHDFVKLLSNTQEEIEVLVGDLNLLPSFNKKLLNKNVGDEVDHLINLGDKVNTVQFTIKQISEGINYTMKDCFDFFKVQNEQELKELFKNKLQEEADICTKLLTLNQIKKQIINLKFDIPMSLISNEYNFIYNQELFRLGYKQEESEEEFLKEKLNISKANFEKYVLNLSEEMAKVRLYTQKEAKKNNIIITDEDFELEIQKNKQFFKNNYEKTKEFIFEEQMKKKIGEQILQEKVLLFLNDKIKVKKTYVDLKTLYDMDNINNHINNIKNIDIKKTNNNDNEQTLI